MKRIHSKKRRDNREAEHLWRQMIYGAFGYLPDDQLNALKTVKAKEISDGLFIIEVRQPDVLEWLDRYCPLINAYLSKWRCRLCVDFRPEGDERISDAG